MRFVPQTRFSIAIVLAVLATALLTPTAMSVQTSEKTCINVSYMPLGSKTDLVVQSGGALVVGVIASSPGDGATLLVTVTPDICTVAATVQTSNSEAPLLPAHELAQASILP